MQVSKNSLGRSVDGSLSQSKTVTPLNLRMSPGFLSSFGMSGFSDPTQVDRIQQMRGTTVRPLLAS